MPTGGGGDGAEVHSLRSSAVIYPLVTARAVAPSPLEPAVTTDWANNPVPNPGLRKRKNRACWSNGAETSKRPLLVIGDLATVCQIGGLKLAADSRTKFVSEVGQDGTT